MSRIHHIFRIIEIKNAATARSAKNLFLGKARYRVAHINVNSKKAVIAKEKNTVNSMSK